MIMRRLMSLVLILAILSITPASVYVCGFVNSPERILHLNGETDVGVEVDCSPMPVLVSSMTFSNFLQTGFFTTFAAIALLFTFSCFLFDTRLLQKEGCVILPPTPPPTNVKLRLNQ